MYCSILIVKHKHMKVHVVNPHFPEECRNIGSSEKKQDARVAAAARFRTLLSVRARKLVICLSIRVRA